MDIPVLCYREVIPNQTSPENCRDIELNTGAAQSTLQEIKVAEKAGGYCYNQSTTTNRNRFIYWRSNHDTLQLTEISLDVNLHNNTIRYKFTDSPILNVSIFEHSKFVVILVSTVSSIHRLTYLNPDKLHKSNSTVDLLSLSIFHDASPNSIRDPSTFYVLGQNASTNHPIPHAATSCLLSSGQEALFAMAFQTNLMLFSMNCVSGQTTSVELKQHYIVPRIFSTFTGALRGKTNTMDSQFATSLVFNNVNGQTFLYALYRDDHIRMWSTIKTNLQCLATISCAADGVDQQRPQGPQMNSLRRSATSSQICAFLCYSTGSEFITIETHSANDAGNSFNLERTNLIEAPQYDLVDFEMNDSQIWALWCFSQGQFIVSNYSLKPGIGNNWVNVAMEQSNDAINIDNAIDPKDTYCSRIFHPGKFQRNVIAKALKMFRRSTILADSNLPVNVLKDRVCLAVETEIQNEINGFDINDEDYIDISTKFWEKFYSSCEQYQLKASQAIGLVLMKSIGGICLIKKNQFSILRPCETLEHLMLTAAGGDFIDGGGINDFISNNGSNICGWVNELKQSPPSVGQDFLKLISILSALEQRTSDYVKKDINERLYQLQTPNVVISELVTNMLSSVEYGENMLSHQFCLRIQQDIKSISDLKLTMNILLEALRMDPQDLKSVDDNSHQNMSRTFLLFNNLFGSDIGTSTVAESLKQIILIRFSICRNLLILQQILITKFELPNNTLEEIRTNLMPNTVVFMQSYYLMVWICDTPVPSSGSSVTSLESSVQRLSMLQVGVDSRIFNSNRSEPITLMEIFLKTKGLHCGLVAFVEQRKSCEHEMEIQLWNTLLPLVQCAGQLIWPLSNSFIFGEWLMASGQHILIEQFVRLLNRWCEWNNCSRHFMAAVSHLENGETHKAFDFFMRAAKGVLTEEFLKRIIQTSSSSSAATTAAAASNLSDHKMLAQYYLKVIQLFEQHGSLDHIIALANTAIGILDKNDPQMAMFQSIVFTNHLQLEHFDEAYHALINNAVSSRRKDCLRQLVVCLFQQKRLDLLMGFPYIQLQDQLEEIIESRARSMTIENNSFYGFLYAFHVTKENMRKASSIMYEQAMRYQLESNTITATQNRYECLLSCLNTLNLVDEKYAWIAKPETNLDCVNSRGMGNGITRQNSDELGDIDTSDESGNQQQIVVLEMKDIRKELLLTEAMLLLTKHREDIHSILNADAEQIIAVLANSGLYTAAAKLAQRIGNSVSVVLDSLALACVRAGNENSDETWNWLKENDLADVPHKNVAVDMAWKLLEKLLNENELEHSTQLRKSVATKLLNIGEFLPHWLLLSYKAANPTELLILYVHHGRLIEATQLAIEYIQALMTTGGEYFGLSNSIHINMPAVCFPKTAIDLLIYGLEINKEYDQEYDECLHELRDLVKSYLETMVRVSKNKIDYGSTQNIVKAY